MEKEPEFDLEKLLADHADRNRPLELARSKKTQEEFVAAGGKGKRRSRGAKAQKDPEEWSDDEEQEDYKASFSEKNRRLDDERASFEGDDDVAEIAPRAKSNRRAIRSRALEEYDCVALSESPPPPEKTEKAPIGRAKTRSLKRKSAASPRKSVGKSAAAKQSILKPDASATAPKKAADRTAPRKSVVVVTAPSTAPIAPASASPMLSLRKRQKFEDLTAKEAGEVVDAEVAEAATLVPDDAMIEQLLLNAPMSLIRLWMTTFAC